AGQGAGSGTGPLGAGSGTGQYGQAENSPDLAISDPSPLPVPISDLSPLPVQDVIHVTVDEGPEGLPRVTYELDAAALQRIAETHLGKTILISNREEWSDAQIIAAY